MRQSFSRGKEAFVKRQRCGYDQIRNSRQRKSVGIAWFGGFRSMSSTRNHSWLQQSLSVATITLVKATTSGTLEVRCGSMLVVLSMHGWCSIMLFVGDVIARCWSDWLLFSRPTDEMLVSLVSRFPECVYGSFGWPTLWEDKSVYQSNSCSVRSDVLDRYNHGLQNEWRLSWICKSRRVLQYVSFVVTPHEKHN